MQAARASPDCASAQHIHGCWPAVPSDAFLSERESAQMGGADQGNFKIVRNTHMNSALCMLEGNGRAMSIIFW